MVPLLVRLGEEEWVRPPLRSPGGKVRREWVGEEEGVRVVVVGIGDGRRHGRVMCRIARFLESYV